MRIKKIWRLFIVCIAVIIVISTYKPVNIIPEYIVIVEQILEVQKECENLYFLYTYVYSIDEQGEETLEWDSFVTYIQTNNVTHKYLQNEEYRKAKEMKELLLENYYQER